MGKTENTPTIKAPVVTVDPSLDRYREKNLFPEKLKRANKMLKTAKLPIIEKQDKEKRETGQKISA